MNEDPLPQMTPVGDRCLAVTFGQQLSVEVNHRACEFARRVRAASWPFIIDVVPSFAGVGLHYRPEKVPLRAAQTPLAALEERVLSLLAHPSAAGTSDARTVEIPVCYGGEWGADLADLSGRAGIAPEDLIRQHTEVTGHVFMVGFAPGHPYIGLWGDAFDVPRRVTPRTRVPAGSVAVANRQCVIYPFDLPGGWNLIGRTPRTLFDPAAAEPCLLAPGDRVRFIAISASEFAALQPQRHD
jgi:KipI family sensor histidine kinase inhibitor